MKKTVLALALAFGYAGLQATSMIDPAVAACLRSDDNKTVEQCKAEVYGRPQQAPQPSLPSTNTNVRPISSSFAPTASKGTSSLSYYY